MPEAPRPEEICRKKCKQLTADQLITVGKNVKKLRLKKKLTQNDVGFYTFSDKSSISSLERGVCKNINLLTLVKIAELFSITVEDLLKE